MTNKHDDNNKSINENVDVIEKKSNTSSVSVITKTTSPKVIIQSENFERLNSDLEWKESLESHITWTEYYNLLKILCKVMLVVIILITFFLSLKTYRIVNKLHHSNHECMSHNRGIIWSYWLDLFMR